MIVAIDGPAAAGKGTLARALAARFGYAYLDTGSLYRAVAVRLRRAGMPPDDASAVAAARAVTADDCADPMLRDEESGRLASEVAAIAAVRTALLDYQRQFARHPPGDARGAVLDGRDIGTVVCPDADVKIFVTASIEERARRRLARYHEVGYRLGLCCRRIVHSSASGTGQPTIGNGADGGIRDTEGGAYEVVAPSSGCGSDQSVGH